MSRPIHNRTIIEPEEGDHSYDYNGVAVVISIAATILVLCCGAVIFYRCWVGN